MRNLLGIHRDGRNLTLFAHRCEVIGMRTRTNSKTSAASSSVYPGETAMQLLFVGDLSYVRSSSIVASLSKTARSSPPAQMRLGRMRNLLPRSPTLQGPENPA